MYGATDRGRTTVVNSTLPSLERLLASRCSTNRTISYLANGGSCQPVTLAHANAGRYAVACHCQPVTKAGHDRQTCRAGGDPLSSFWPNRRQFGAVEQAAAQSSRFFEQLRPFRSLQHKIAQSTPLMLATITRSGLISRWLGEIVMLYHGCGHVLVTRAITTF
jgi:hypothetical protein